MFILQVIGVVIFVYGILSLVQDIINEITYKKIFHDMKIVVFAKELEKNIEQFIIELHNMKKVNPYKQITVVDLDKNDDIQKLQQRFEVSEVNVEILDFFEAENFLKNMFY